MKESKNVRKLEDRMRAKTGMECRTDLDVLVLRNKGVMYEDVIRLSQFVQKVEPKRIYVVQPGYL